MLGLLNVYGMCVCVCVCVCVCDWILNLCVHDVWFVIMFPYPYKLLQVQCVLLIQDLFYFIIKYRFMEKSDQHTSNCDDFQSYDQQL